ncbi:MAG: hypothetical protein AB1782_04500 [Cyanobacteriota bacterium]
MSLTQARFNLLNAEKNVTEVLNAHGENSDEYKRALKDFAKNWIFLSRREDTLDSIIDG